MSMLLKGKVRALAENRPPLKYLTTLSTAWAKSADASVQGVRRMNERIAAEPRVTATTLQTVGGKGYDGLAFVLVDR